MARQTLIIPSRWLVQFQNRGHAKRDRVFQALIGAGMGILKDPGAVLGLLGAITDVVAGIAMAGGGGRA